jgi:hypothetical protein
MSKKAAKYTCSECGKPTVYHSPSVCAPCQHKLIQKMLQEPNPDKKYNEAMLEIIETSQNITKLLQSQAAVCEGINTCINLLVEILDNDDLAEKCGVEFVDQGDQNEGSVEFTPDEMLDQKISNSETKRQVEDLLRGMQGEETSDSSS